MWTEDKDNFEPDIESESEDISAKSSMGYVEMYSSSLFKFT